MPVNAAEIRGLNQELLVSFGPVELGLRVSCGGVARVDSIAELVELINGQMDVVGERAKDHRELVPLFQVQHHCEKGREDELLPIGINLFLSPWADVGVSHSDLVLGLEIPKNPRRQCEVFEQLVKGPFESEAFVSWSDELETKPQPFLFYLVILFFHPSVP